MIASVIISYYLGASKNKDANNELNIRFNYVVELEDTYYYTGKYVNDYVYSPIKVVDTGMIPDAETASRITYEYIYIVY